MSGRDDSRRVSCDDLRDDGLFPPTPIVTPDETSVSCTDPFPFGCLIGSITSISLFFSVTSSTLFDLVVSCCSFTCMIPLFTMSIPSSVSESVGRTFPSLALRPLTRYIPERGVASSVGNTRDVSRIIGVGEGVEGVVVVVEVVITLE